MDEQTRATGSWCGVACLGREFAGVNGLGACGDILLQRVSLETAKWKVRIVGTMLAGRGV